MKQTNLSISYNEKTGEVSFNINQLKALFSSEQQVDPTPVVNPTNNDWKVSLIIKNETESAIQSTGEIRLYINNHIGINTYLPGAKPAAGALYTFNAGENKFTNIACTINGADAGDTMNNYNGAVVNDVRFYDQRHYNNIDAGFNIVLDTNDSRCDKIIKQGGTYVLKITKK